MRGSDGSISNRPVLQQPARDADPSRSSTGNAWHVHRPGTVKARLGDAQAPAHRVPGTTRHNRGWRGEGGNPSRLGPAAARCPRGHSTAAPVTKGTCPNTETRGRRCRWWLPPWGTHCVCEQRQSGKHSLLRRKWVLGRVTRSLQQTMLRSRQGMAPVGTGAWSWGGTGPRA